MQRQVPLVPVAELIVVCEELVVITVETVAKAADLCVPARMPLPEFLDRLLVHTDLHNSRSQRPAVGRRVCRMAPSSCQAAAFQGTARAVTQPG